MTAIPDDRERDEGRPLNGLYLLIARLFGLRADEWRSNKVIRQYVETAVTGLLTSCGALPLLAWGVWGDWPQDSVVQKIFLLSPGFGAVVVAGSGIALRLVRDTQTKVLREVEAERIQVHVDVGRNLEALRDQQRERERELFRSNLEHTFVLQQLELHNVRFFEDTLWRFAPHVNVLLGRNGYGKTLLFRTLAALIQADAENSQALVRQPQTGSTPRGTENDQPAREVRLTVTKNGENAVIVRDAVSFVAGVGKIPLLAVPDSRFVNRAVTVVEPPASGGELSDAETGAYHFLSQQPFGNRVDQLLYQLGIDHNRPRALNIGNRGFDQPIFRLLEETVQTLTDEERFHFREIRRSGATGFQILVSTSADREELLPIQYASQGTLSVLAIFGLIYNFLEALRPMKDVAITDRAAIVIIDEIDAHLHPSWQQKMMGILTKKFPNVQFIVSAHSPMIVAGCDAGEVSVLSRPPKSDRFKFEMKREDYLGISATELYKNAFFVDLETDRLFLKYAEEAKRRKPGAVDPERMELERLKETSTLNQTQEARLTELRREDRLINRAQETVDKRDNVVELKARISKLELENRLLKAAQRAASSSS